MSDKEIRLGEEEMEWVKPYLDSAEEIIASVKGKLGESDVRELADELYPAEGYIQESLSNLHIVLEKEVRKRLFA